MSYMVVRVLYSVMLLVNKLALEFGVSALIKDHTPIILDLVPAVWKLSVFHTDQSSAKWSTRPQSFSLDSRLLVFPRSSADSPWWVGFTCNSLLSKLTLLSFSPCVTCVIRLKVPSWRPNSAGYPFPLWERETPCWRGLSSMTRSPQKPPVLFL